MIVLSIAPGLRRIAWSVLYFPRREIRAELRGCAIENHGNKHPDVSSFERLLAHANVHWLILTVLLQRHTPGLLAMSGKSHPKEPEERVEAVRCLFRSLFLGVGIPVQEFDDRDEVFHVLGIAPRQATQVAGDLLGGHLPTRATRRPIPQTILTAAAAARVIFELPVEQGVSRETVSGGNHDDDSAKSVFRSGELAGGDHGNFGLLPAPSVVPVLVPETNPTEVRRAAPVRGGRAGKARGAAGDRSPSRQ